MFAHKECAKFYHCAHGRTFIKNCGHGRVFDPKLQICNWPHAVVCPIKETTTTTTTTITKEKTVNIKQVKTIIKYRNQKTQNVDSANSERNAF